VKELQPGVGAGTQFVWKSGNDWGIGEALIVFPRRSAMVAEGRVLGNTQEATENLFGFCLIACDKLATAD
jgi:hypothetical protein